MEDPLLLFKERFTEYLGQKQIPKIFFKSISGQKSVILTQKPTAKTDAVIQEFLFFCFRRAFTYSSRSGTFLQRLSETSKEIFYQNLDFLL